VADNVELNAGTGGDLIAADDDGTAKHQYVKLEFGADNTQTKVSASDPLPVVQTGTHSVNVAAVVPGTGATALGKAVDAAAGATDTGVVGLAIRDDGLSALGAAEGDYVPHRVDANGALWTHDDALDACVSGSELQVDIVAALPAGTNNIGDVDILSIAAGDNNIGNVDVVSLPALPAGTNNIGDVDVLTVPADPFGVNADAAVAAGAAGSIQAKLRRATQGLEDLKSLIVLAAGTNNIGDVDVLTVVPGTGATNLGKAEDAAHTSGDTGVYALAVRDDAPAAHSGTDGDYESLHVNAEGGLWVTNTPSTAGGLTIFRSIDLDETEEEVKATAGALYGWYIANLRSSPLFVKFYNATTANVTVGTTTPVMTFPMPANSTNYVAANATSAHGITFSTAITVAATTGVADNDTGAPGANECVVNLWYK
jgi:hypothetical protein